MQLPPDFHFSQHALQDLAECACRFQLRHVQRLPWPGPAPDPEPARRARAGSHFHRAVQQYLAGVPADRIAASLLEADLRRWWAAFLATAPALWGGGERPAARRSWAEVTLQARLGARPLLAKYDLAVLTPAGGVMNPSRPKS